MGNAVKADYTVSFIGLKQGMFTGSAAEYCGNIIFSSLDISKNVYQQVDFASRLIRQCCLPKRHRCAHKGNYGHVLVVGGDAGFTGAIRLAAEASLRIGAGLVSIATRKIHSSFINIGRPELMCYGIEKSDELIPLLAKASVVVIGPGLGQSQWAKALFAQVVTCKKPLLIDADGLNILANNLMHHDDWVLTPHPGEAARLLSCSTIEIADNRFEAVSQLQKKFGGVAVLKGAGTLINNGKETLVSTTGNPGMASGGMGDTLAGMIAGLIAQNMALDVAAWSAVYLHGKAADLCARENGEKGLLASDLMPYIRKLVNSYTHS
jgi:NAD(P)H-hydrate epimerase